MKYFKPTKLLVLILLISIDLTWAKESDPLISMFTLDQLERRNSQESDFTALEAQGWIGKDFDKIRFKLESEFTSSKTESAELQLVYSRAVSAF